MAFAAYIKRGKPTTEYKAYQDAKGWCQNPNRTSYKNYGGRGIEFRLSSFQEMMEAIGPKPDPKLSLDRIDNDGHYEVGNLRWADATTQSRNRRMNTPEQKAKIPGLVAGHVRWHRSLTHCKHGHEFTTENTSIRKDGTRHCKRCYADCQKRLRARRKAAKESA